MYLYVKKNIAHCLIIYSPFPPFCLNWSKLVNVVMPIFILKIFINLQFYSFFLILHTSYRKYMSNIKQGIQGKGVPFLSTYIAFPL